MNIELPSAHIPKVVTRWLRAGGPMLAVVAFVAVTFLAGAVWTGQEVFAADLNESVAAEAMPAQAAEVGPMSQELGVAGRLESILVKAPEVVPAADAEAAPRHEPEAP